MNNTAEKDFFEFPKVKLTGRWTNLKHFMSNFLIIQLAKNH